MKRHSLNFPDQLYAALAKAAEDDHRSFSAYCTMVLQRWADRNLSKYSRAVASPPPSNGKHDPHREFTTTEEVGAIIGLPKDDA